MSRRFGTLCTAWLIAQILLPFTAPFPVCDLKDFLGPAHYNSEPVTPRPMPRRKPLADASYAYAPPLQTVDGRLRLVVVTHADAVTALRRGPDPRAVPRFTGDFTEPQRQLQHQRAILRL